MYAPMGDGGVYEYVELWYGFAVKKEIREMKKRRCFYLELNRLY